jgi:hypothetical protein
MSWLLGSRQDFRLQMGEKGYRHAHINQNGHISLQFAQSQRGTPKLPNNHCHITATNVTKGEEMRISIWQSFSDHYVKGNPDKHSGTVKNS